MQRADRLLVRLGHFESRAQARAAIEAGCVRADGQDLRKPSQLIGTDAVIEAQPAHPYVSRAALKLLHALETFAVDVSDRQCLDLGASTGGFTEVLLERGAARVTAVDVGTGQLHDRLRSDPRITVLQPSRVRELTIQRGDAPGFRLEKSPGGGWTFAKDSATDFTPDADEVDKLLKAITQATAAQYLADAAIPQQYLARVVLSTRETGRDDTLLLYEGPPLDTAEGEPRRSIMVLRNDESTGYLVPAEKLAAVFRPAVELRSHDILTLTPQELREVRLEREDGVTYVFRERSDPRDPAGRPRWTLVGHDQFEERQFIELLRNFVPFSAGQWLEGEAQLGEQTVKLALVPKAEGAEPRVLTVNVDNRHARMTGVDTPFRVMPVTLAALTAEYRDRTVFDASIHQLGVVQYTASGRVLRLKRDELGRFAVVDAAGKRVAGYGRLNQQIAAALFDALAPLRVERYVEKPEDVKPGDARRVIHTRTDTLKQLELRFDFPDHAALATDGERWFTLTGDTRRKLDFVSPPAENNPAPTPQQ